MLGPKTFNVITTTYSKVPFNKFTVLVRALKTTNTVEVKVYTWS